MDGAEIADDPDVADDARNRYVEDAEDIEDLVD